jgi:hypothetical protein
VFRTACGDPNQLPNVRWLRGEVSRVLYELTGLWPDVRYRRNAPDGGYALIADWYGLLGHAPSVEAWAATYGEVDPPPALVDALLPDYDRALAIGFELSPLMRSILDRIGAPWVDVEVSPLRFLDDLALSLRCSWPVQGPVQGPVEGPVDRIAHPGLVSARHVAEAVARQRALHRDDPAAAACNGATIFLAQTRYDRTLIRDGVFFPDAEAVERVAQGLDGRRLVLKPHPLAPDTPLVGMLRQRCAGQLTEANIYALLAAARDVELVTISSSAAIEARHFGHRPRMLNPAAHARRAPFTSLWAHRSAAFWRAALAPILRVKAGAAFEERTIPDRLRRNLGAWGFARTGAVKPPEGRADRKPHDPKHDHGRSPAPAGQCR